MTQMPYNILFICTGNSARSILAEALINHSGSENFRAWSAGSQPRGEIHPMTLTTLEHLHIPTNDLYSKSWDEFTTDDAPRFDFIITVCDKAAGEVCPVWPGTPITAHWGVPDPATEGPEALQRFAFAEVARVLKRRIDLFMALPLSKIDAMSLQHELRAIGQQT